MLRPTGGDTLADVLHHVSCLLNTRQGTLPHDPHYGLGDLLSVYQSLPDQLQVFAQTVTEQLHRYEPRLKNVQVSVALSQQLTIVTLTIQALWQERPIAFVGHCHPNGLMTVAL